MSREFSLVLLGAGILTAGYFMAPSPEDELEKKAEEQAAERVYANNEHRSHVRGGFLPLLLWVHSPAFTGGAAGGKSPAMSSVSRGGFGGIGKAAAGG
jgi:hypothetical protein